MKGSCPTARAVPPAPSGDGMDLPHFGAHVAGFEQAEDIFEFRSAESPTRLRSSWAQWSIRLECTELSA